MIMTTLKMKNKELRAMMSDRDIASSDRLDYAREKVRSGQWDDTQRQEFLRGA